MKIIMILAKVIDKAEKWLLGARSLEFQRQLGRRYWWFQKPRNKYVPTVFSSLSHEEWKHISDWYRETDEKQLIGECNIPLISLLQGFITGNGLERVVQLGHYSGFSTLLLGFFLRSMQKSTALFSIDIDPNVSAFMQGWVEKTGLTEVVHVEVSDSVKRGITGKAKKYLGGRPELIFIDSSHQYEHTLHELKMWSKVLQPGGFIFLHDTSIFASSFDSTRNGGVARALKEWIPENLENFAFLNINKPIAGTKKESFVYQDACGLGILYKFK